MIGSLSSVVLEPSGGLFSYEFTCFSMPDIETEASYMELGSSGGMSQLSSTLSSACSTLLSSMNDEA